MRASLANIQLKKDKQDIGVLMPIYFLFKTFGLLDNVIGLIIIYTLMNLPIAVWMSYTYFCEILEAGRIDGANLWEEIWYLLRPMALPGLSSTGLILVIFAWHEAFWSINLTSARAAPLTVFIASYSSLEGLFWAKLSAASLLAVAVLCALPVKCVRASRRSPVQSRRDCPLARSGDPRRRRGAD
jgi:sorbitol/mannitol transport system permease protein